MTFADVLAALIILGLFFAGFSQAVTPMYAAWSDAGREYRTAKSIEFIAESFRNECARPNSNINNWKKAVADVLKPDTYEITEIRQGDILRAYRLICVVGGQAVEVIGLFTP